MNRRWIYAILIVLALSTMPAIAGAMSARTPTGSGLHGSVEAAIHAGRGVTPLGISPGQPIANPRTHTLYVALQCGNPSTGKSCSATAGHVLDVFDTARCKPGARCRAIAKAQAGKIPLAETIDPTTDTIYVGDATGTITVVDGARCNASVRSGCNKPLATINTGGFIVALAFNPKTRTVYAANAGPKGSVLVIDASHCNARSTAGCDSPVKEVKDPLIPDAVAVDRATGTVYAANGGPDGNGNTVSLINGATCNGHSASGCGQTPHTATVGSGAFWDDVDQSTNTVYVANAHDGTVSVINGAKCNAKVTSGCNGIPAAPTGAGVGFIVLDQARHTVFALNQDDGTMSAIDTKTCNGRATSGCRRRVPNQQATFSPPYGYNPNQFALTPSGTAYLVNVGGEPFLGAISVKHCSAENKLGCRDEAPTARNQEFLMSIDPSTHTIYAGNQNHPRIDVLNAATCNAARLSGCAPVGEIPMPNQQGNVGAIDHATHTLYAADPYGSTISVINIARCKAADISGCSAVAPKITVGPGPGQPVLDRKTHTLYAPDGPLSNEVAVIDASTCNATKTSGCSQTPAQVPVGKGAYNLALSQAKDTVYAANSGFTPSSPLGHTVSVIDGATCNASEQSGCAHPVATVKVGIAPFGLAVDDQTHTLYVSNNQAGDLPGTVSLINTATCNGSNTAGCADHMPTAPVGRSPGNVAVDAANDSVYVANFASASVSVLNGSKCRAGRTSGCTKAVHDEPVGSVPQGLAVDPALHSVYAANSVSPPSLSIFHTSQ